MPETVRMVAVHYANRSGRGKAAFFLPYDAARELVDARMADWSRRATYINLRKTEAELPKPAPSLNPNMRIMDDFVDGKRHAVEIINAYRHLFAA